MRKSRFSERQILGILQQVERGQKVKDVCRLVRFARLGDHATKQLDLDQRPLAEIVAEGLGRGCRFTAGLPRPRRP